MDTTRPSRRLRRGLAALAVGALAAVGAAACQPAPGDCSKDCIDFVLASQGGDRLSIATIGAVRTEVTIYSDPQRTTVAGYGRTHTPTGYASVPITAKYYGLPPEAPALAQLKPATTYWYTARGTDGGARTWTQLGTFRTQQRTITVSLSSIEVFDDSDLSGAGELTFQVRANGGAASQVIGYSSWASGPPKPVSITKAYPGVLPTFTFQIRGVDDDCLTTTCTAPASAWEAKGGNGDTQWATATLQLTVPNQEGAGTTGSFLVTGGKGGGIGDLGFHVTGSWKVTYSHA